VAGSAALTGAAERLEGFARERLDVPGLAVGLIGPGGWRRECAVGVADVASGRAMEPGALLPVASISKAMTAAALLREHQAGRVGLDDPVHDHLPWLPLPTPFGPITVAHLLAHTGGIVIGMEGSPSPVAEALALGLTAPGWPPGERFSYSNVGYAVLGLVLERVAGCPYAEAIQRQVLDPCAMTASEPVTTAEAQARAATGHLELAGPGFGYGLVVKVETEAGYRRVGHQGDCPGFCGYAHGCPETGVGVVTLGNGPWRPPASSGTRAVVSGWPFDRVGP
jgi:D-alanyl-D-alanine carboxypeptidase